MHKYNILSGSVICAWFVFVYNCATAVLWILFIKIVWFDKHRLECIVNTLTSNVFKTKHLLMIATATAVMALSQINASYGFAYKIAKFAAKTNFIYTGHISLWTSQHWGLMIALLYVMEYYFIQECLIFTLHCSLLGKAWELRRQLKFIGAQNLEKVFT